MDNPSDSGIKEILTGAKTVAVVGLSDKPDRPSYRVASFLKEKGYRVIPVNPGKTEILSEKCYAGLGAIPEKVDVVCVFRKSEDALAVAEEAVAIKPEVLWLQLGVVNEEAAKLAGNAGMKVVMDRCMAIEHRRLLKE